MLLVILDSITIWRLKHSRLPVLVIDDLSARGTELWLLLRLVGHVFSMYFRAKTRWIWIVLKLFCKGECRFIFFSRSAKFLKSKQIRFGLWIWILNSEEDKYLSSITYALENMGLIITSFWFLVYGTLHLFIIKVNMYLSFAVLNKTHHQH